jgi:hypothetical protein
VSYGKRRLPYFVEVIDVQSKVPREQGVKRLHDSICSCPVIMVVDDNTKLNCLKSFWIWIFWFGIQKDSLSDYLDQVTNLFMRQRSCYSLSRSKIHRFLENSKFNYRTHKSHPPNHVLSYLNPAHTLTLFVQDPFILPICSYIYHVVSLFCLFHNNYVFIYCNPFILPETSAYHEIQLTVRSQSVDMSMSIISTSGTNFST